MRMLTRLAGLTALSTLALAVGASAQQTPPQSPQISTSALDQSSATPANGDWRTAAPVTHAMRCTDPRTRLAG